MVWYLLRSRGVFRAASARAAASEAGVPFRLAALSSRPPAVLLVLHAPDLSLQLLIAELQLLDHTGELPDLAFKPLEAHHKIRAARLGCVLDRLNGAIAAHAPAPAEDEIKQAARALAFLCACRANRTSNDNRRQSEHGCASKPEAIHGLNKLPEWLDTIRIPASKL